MSWLQRYLSALITLAALLIGGAIGYGRMQQICTQVESKADQHEIAQIGAQLNRIESKVDAFILQHQQ